MVKKKIDFNSLTSSQGKAEEQHVNMLSPIALAAKNIAHVA